MTKPKAKTKLVSVESPYNSPYPWHQLRNIQYAILANTHAASLGDVTWTPHICNTQVVKWGLNGYISDSLAGWLITNKTINQDGNMTKYFLGREETLRVTNLTRQQKMDRVVCYTDYGISSGMRGAIQAAKKAGVPVEYRKLPGDLKKEIFGESFISTAVPLAKMVSICGLSFYGLLKILRKGR